MLPTPAVRVRFSVPAVPIIDVFAKPNEILAPVVPVEMFESAPNSTCELNVTGVLFVCIAPDNVTTPPAPDPPSADSNNPPFTVAFASDTVPVWKMSNSAAPAEVTFEPASVTLPAVINCIVPDTVVGSVTAAPDVMPPVWLLLPIIRFAAVIVPSSAFERPRLPPASVPLNVITCDAVVGFSVTVPVVLIVLAGSIAM